MLGKSKIFVAPAFIFTLIFAASVEPSVANANSKTVTVQGNNLNGEFVITGKGGLFNKQYSFTITNKGSKNVQVYQILTPMGVREEANLGVLYHGQSRTVQFNAKGNIKVGYAFQISMGGSGSKAVIEISTPNGLTVQ